MQQEFAQPPSSALPRVWWHWLSGNVTKEGITADLEWMHRVNIGGFQMFDGDLSTPRFVDRPLVWMSPEWKDAWRHSAAEADRLHLEMGMAASGGWSETAGPWVRPEQGMKKYVWSEASVAGPGRVHQRLALPPDTVGKLQTMPVAPEMAFPTPNDLPGTKPALSKTSVSATLPFYRDVQVVAYKQRSIAREGKPTITSSSPSALDAEVLEGHDLGRTTLLRVPPEAKEGWVQFRYPEAVTTYGMTIGVGIAGGFLAPALPVGVLEASDDGANWRSLAQLPGSPQSPTGSITVRTYAYAPVTAAYYRLRVQPPALAGAALALGAPAPAGVTLSELVLHTSPQVNHWQDKAAFGMFVADASTPTPEVAGHGAIEASDVIDLTSKTQPDGTLDWTAPPGDWIVLRFGYGLTGEMNHPATAAATGLEVDKLSRADVQSYATTYTGMISGVAGDLYGKSFRNFLMDSWEAGNENWTERMPQEFLARRGYSLTPYLPVLTGNIVGSSALSDAFLWDFRRTMGEMLAENHYGTFSKAIQPAGLSLYAEAMGTDLPTNGDGLLNKGNVDVPMGEFWTPAAGQRDLPAHVADIREAASAAHIYGKPIVAAESFTTLIGVPGWGQSPFYLKPLADENFARGINRIVIHTSDHQPFVDDAHKPGLTLGPFGQNYTRNITWAEQAVAWNTYLARCSYLLQQGSFVADVAYFYGEGSPVTVPYWKPVIPAAPTHYGYDFVNSDVLLHHASVRDKQLKLDSGMSYRLLVFPADTHTMTVAMMRKLRDIVSAGATLLAPRPETSPSLEDAARTREFEQLRETLWGSASSTITDRLVGRGRVVSSGEVEAVLGKLSVPPDLTYSEATGVGPELSRPMPLGDSDDDLVYLHRRSPEADIYFLATQKRHSFDTIVSFRIAGRTPTLWNPLTGQRRAVSFSTHDGSTSIRVHFDAEGSVFVVFEGSAEIDKTVPEIRVKTLQRLDQGWKLTFPGDGIQPDFASLVSWTELLQPSEKYFSGTAVYSRSVHLKAVEPDKDLILDLGDVREIAQVRVNGKSLDTILWSPPYKISLTGLLHPGDNDVEVSVTNLWPNRLIGDEQPGITQRHSFTSIHAYSKDSPLFTSGMLGPVVLLESESKLPAQ